MQVEFTSGISNLPTRKRGIEERKGLMAKHLRFIFADKPRPDPRQFADLHLRGLLRQRVLLKRTEHKNGVSRFDHVFLNGRRVLGCHWVLLQHAESRNWLLWLYGVLRDRT